MHRILIFFILSGCFSSIQGQTALSASDLHFLSFRTDDSKAFSMVVWKDLTPGTRINFTDNGWGQNDSLAFSNSSEGLLQWLCTDSISAGAVIGFYADTLDWSSSSGVCHGNLNELSDSGDQLFAFQGRLDSVHFLAGINFDGQGWALDRLDEHTSAIPPAIQAECMHLNETDNAHFAGIRFNHRIQQYVHWVEDTDNSWLVYDVDSIFQLPDLTPFVLIPNASAPLWGLRRLSKQFGQFARPQWHWQWPLLNPLERGEPKILVQITSFPIDDLPQDSVFYANDTNLSDGRAWFWVDSQQSRFSEVRFPAGVSFDIRFVPAHCYGQVCLFQRDSAIVSDHLFTSTATYSGMPERSFSGNPASGGLAHFKNADPTRLEPQFYYHEGHVFWKNVPGPFELILTDMTGSILLHEITNEAAGSLEILEKTAQFCILTAIGRERGSLLFRNKIFIQP